jgi:hypothetical protein
MAVIITECEHVSPILVQGFIEHVIQRHQSILRSPVKELKMPETVAVVERSFLSALIHHGGPTTSSKVNWTGFSNSLQNRKESAHFRMSICH